MLLDMSLRQHQMGLRGPGTHHLDRYLAPVTIMGRRLVVPIDGDRLRRQDGVDRLYPREKTRLKPLWVQTREDAPKGIMRGNAIGQLQKCLQPRSFRVPELFDIYPGVRSTNDRT